MSAPRFRLLPVLLLTLLTAAPALGQTLQTRVERIVRAADVGNASVGLRIVDADTGERLAALDDELPLIPASNMKLLTTAAALDTLGPRFVFSTQLRVEGRTLIVRGNGDPGFGDPVLLEAMDMDPDGLLDRWADAVRRTGIDRFEAIIVDDRAFDDQFIHPTWPADQLDRWYCAQVAAINFNDNCLNVYASPGAAGAAPRITIEPEHAAVVIENMATSGSRNALWASRQPGTNRIHLRGQVQHALTRPIHVTIHDPPIFFADTLAAHLAAAGIAVDQTRRIGEEEALPGGRLIAAVETTLPTVLVRCNRDSQNLFAEAILKHLGHRLTGRPGSWSNGAAAVRSFLVEVVGSDAASVAIADGSGMSRDNRLTARLVCDLLTYMHRHESADLYRLTLAAPGERGTLSNRFTGANLRGDVRAKTGYLRGAVALSGYITRDERTIAYSVLVNGFTGGAHHARTMMERIVAEIDGDLAEAEAANLGG